MERVKKEENQKGKINRMISYFLIIVSFIALFFCLSEIFRYVIYVNKNATLTSDLETLKQDSNYFQQNFNNLIYFYFNKNLYKRGYVCYNKIYKLNIKEVLYGFKNFIRRKG